MELTKTSTKYESFFLKIEHKQHLSNIPRSPHCSRTYSRLHLLSPEQLARARNLTSTGRNPTQHSEPALTMHWPGHSGLECESFGHDRRSLIKSHFYPTPSLPVPPTPALAFDRLGLVGYQDFVTLNYFRFEVIDGEDGMFCNTATVLQVNITDHNSMPAVEC
ncbi:hypothetical protein CEXT_561381 [Caerostris extrusa]|uniref:Uncharacterized protein n=1 Tax=Caerostris extrusa TaxID=172846 RepID=A0AAV4U2S3_CAEEX|nr:hypothetical protein CEXT_561381 [Caerostris extrusa]